eukprot:COSAG02_NODE_10523_length_1922_cov_4.374109_1_plen_136_part_10
MPGVEIIDGTVAAHGLAHTQIDAELQNATRVWIAGQEREIALQSTDSRSPWVVQTVSFCLLPCPRHIDPRSQQSCGAGFESLAAGNQLRRTRICTVVHHVDLLAKIVLPWQRGGGNQFSWLVDYIDYIPSSTVAPI